MLLRRITEHVKAQNWTAVALDFLIVVVGVFVGIQLGNLNEARSNHRLGGDYSVRLIADLERDLAGNLVIYDYYTEVLASIETADRLLSSPDPDPKELVAAAYRASEFSSNPSNVATWEQIVSSGHLGLLPIAAIESGLSEYYKYQDSNNDTNDLLQGSPYRLAVRSLIPLAVQLAIREGCSDVVDETSVIAGFAAECRIDVDEALLEETARTLMSSTAIRDTVRHQYSMVAAVRNNTNGDVVLLRRAIDALRTNETAS